MMDEAWEYEAGSCNVVKVSTRFKSEFSASTTILSVVSLWKSLVSTQTDF